MNPSRTFPVAIESKVQPFSLARAKLDGVELVIWKGSSGKIHVWEDTCPHRSTRLSAGRNLGDQLEDVYHGWRFAENGTLSLIPAARKTERPDISVRVLASSVSGGFVWATLNDEPQPDPNFNGLPLRPIHCKAPAKVVNARLSAVTALNLIVTPWSETESMIFGVTDRFDKAGLRVADRQLVKLRRNVERAVQ